MTVIRVQSTDDIPRDHAGLAYIVFDNFDLSAVPMPQGYFTLGPGRKTIHWRGKKFTVPAQRVTGFHWGVPPESDE